MRNCYPDACGKQPAACAGLTPTCEAPSLTYGDAGIVLSTVPDGGSVELKVAACYEDDGQNGVWGLTYELSQ